ncbi:MAG: hypothetical protein ACI901_001851 [Octadecabacter sp.]|jgi:hypothetical protein
MGRGFFYLDSSDQEELVSQIRRTPRQVTFPILNGFFKIRQTR